MRAPHRCWVGVALSLCTATAASAQELSLTGPLKAAPAGKQYWRRGRWLLAPNIAVALASNLRVSFAVGGEGLYHTAEWLGVGLRSQLSLPFRPSTTDRRLLLAPELVLIPYEHRASLFHAIYFHYDLHLQAGPARVWSWGRPGSHSTWAALVGGGLTGFSASSFSMSLDYRAIIDASLEHVLALSFDFWPQTRKWDELMAPPNR